MTVKDVYKMEVLGDGNLFKDNDIDSDGLDDALKSAEEAE